jgi:MFS family permease
VNRTVVLLCLFIFGSTFSIGAFPVLLPEIARDGAVSDVALGAIAGAFGLARVIADIPAGLFITHHLRRALVLAAVCLVSGVVCLSIGASLGMMVLGRGLWGAGHALVMLSGITAIVRYAPTSSLSTSLNAFEMSAMLGVLLGMVGTGLLPSSWPWNVSLAVASSPLLVGVVLLPSLLRAIPAEPGSRDRPWFARVHGDTATGSAMPRFTHLTVLAFLSGSAIALAWSAVGQFVLPLRASREFELDRTGVALLVALPQFVDVALLLPVGAYADRTSRVKMLGWILLVFAVAVAAVSFGSLSVVLAGCVMFGVGLAAWMLPVNVLNQEGAQASIAWRTALYRVAVDAGVFLGPVISGLLLGHSLLWVVGLAITALLAVLALLLLRHEARSPSVRRID